MPVISALSVVFIGVAGGGKVDQQVTQVIEAAHLTRASVPAATVRTLARHGEGSQELVEHMHVDGVICGEVVGNSLHLVIYNGEGSMKSYNEISIAGRALTKTELEVLHDNIVDEISGFSHVAPPPVVVAKLEPKPKKKAAIADPFANEIEMDAAPAAPLEKATPEKAEETHEAAPVETASVSVEEMEAMTSGGEVNQGGGGTVAISPVSLHLAAELGFGVAGRSFSPGPATVAAYSSSPVGAVHLAAHVQPTERTRLDAAFEHTTSMSTPLAGGSAPTDMSRWEVSGSYALVHGDSLDVRAQLGLGHRSFTIDSIDPARSPDGDYDYLIAGATAAIPVGHAITIEGNLALEPVLWGDDSTVMSFGPASRWAVDAGIAAEVRPTQHIFVRAALDYQRFSWSWDTARGAGGAVDGYPSGMLSLGAQL